MSAREIENFGRNIRFTPAAFYEPANEEEVLEILNRHKGESIRVMGRLHAWSEAVQTEGVVLDLKHLAYVKIEDGARACVGAGCQVKLLLSELKSQGGYTLPSVGLITEQAIAGAISTGTHGSGKHSISHYVEAVRVACYDPETGQAVIREITEGKELLAARCSLGNLGVIVSVTMQIRQQYRVEEHFRRYKTLAEVLDAESAYPLQQFFLIPWAWEFMAQHRKETESPRSKLAWLYRIYWFLLIDLGMHLVILLTMRALKAPRLMRFIFRRIVPLLVIRNWKVVDESSKMLVMEHELFRHLETELFVQGSKLEQATTLVTDVLKYAAGTEESPGSNLLELLPEQESRERLQSLKGVYSHHYPICVRRVLPDETLISMASGGEESWYAISLITYEHPSRRQGFFQVAALLAETMARLFAARPHWGKHCPLAPEEAVILYERFDDYREVCSQFDPEGVFCNRWTKSLLDAQAQPNS